MKNSDSKINNKQNGKETGVMENSDSKINNKQNGKETVVMKNSDSKINNKQDGKAVSLKLILLLFLLFSEAFMFARSQPAVSATLTENIC